MYSAPRNRSTLGKPMKANTFLLSLVMGLALLVPLESYSGDEGTNVAQGYKKGFAPHQLDYNHLPGDVPLTKKQWHGEAVFMRHCSLCHRIKAYKPTPFLPYGPLLTDVLAKPNRQLEAAVREVILKGGPKMPGFQYGLSKRDIDALIDYLTTLHRNANQKHSAR